MLTLTKENARWTMRNKLSEWYLDDISRLSREGFVHAVLKVVTDLVKIQTEHMDYSEIEQIFMYYLSTQTEFDESLYGMMLSTFVADD